MSLFDDKVRELMASISEKAKAEAGAENSELRPEKQRIVIESAHHAKPAVPEEETVPISRRSEDSGTGMPESALRSKEDYLLARKQAEDDLARLLAKFRGEEPYPQSIAPEVQEPVPEVFNAAAQPEPEQTVQSPPLQKLKKENRRRWKDVIVISLIAAAMLVIPFVIYRLIA